MKPSADIGRRFFTIDENVSPHPYTVYMELTGEERDEAFYEAGIKEGIRRERQRIQGILANEQ
jgi:hypothetical protein